jgi:hypothetical protein
MVSVKNNDIEKVEPMSMHRDKECLGAFSLAFYVIMKCSIVNTINPNRNTPKVSMNSRKSMEKNREKYEKDWKK